MKGDLKEQEEADGQGAREGVGRERGEEHDAKIQNSVDGNVEKLMES